MPDRSRQPSAAGFRKPRLWFLPLPILKGPLQGRLWLPAAGGKLPRVLLSTYEREQTALFEDLVRPGEVVLDVGAAAGYYTLLSSKLVGPHGRVIAFEADPANAFFLRQHVRLNRARNVTVYPVAVANQNGRLRFGGGRGTGTGHLCNDGHLEVPVVRVDDVLDHQAIRPSHMKIDVEGAEREVLLGAASLLQSCQPTLYLSTHGPDVHAACCELLRDFGYQLTPILGDDLETTAEVLAERPQQVSVRIPPPNHGSALCRAV